MELLSIALLASGLVLMGAAVTYLLTRLVDEPALNLAAQHGRFAGLGEDERPAAPRAPRLRHTPAGVRHAVGSAQ